VEAGAGVVSALAPEPHPHAGGAPQHPDAPLDIPTDLFNSDTNRLSFSVAIFLSLVSVMRITGQLESVLENPIFTTKAPRH
jgi:hypothetical protein